MRERSRGKIALLSMVVLAAIGLAGCQGAPAPAATAVPTKPPAPAAAAPTAPAAAAPTAPTAAQATVAPAATAAPAASKTVTVKIGHLAQTTGVQAVNGVPAAKGINDYFQWVNDQGGIAYKDPKTGETVKAKFDVAVDDYAYDAAKGLNLYQRHKDAGVKAIISNGTPLVAALAEPVSKDKIPVLLFASPSDVSLKPTPRYLITASMAYNKMENLFLKWAKDNWKESRAPKLGMVYIDAASGVIATAGVPEYAKSIGWEVLPAEAIAEPATDTSIQMKRLLSLKPDYIYASNTSNGAAVMMKDAARLGFQGQGQWVIMGSAFDVSTLQKVADAETNGVMSMIYTAMPSELNLPGVQLADTISRKYQNAPLENAVYLQQGVGVAAVLVSGIKAALEKAGYDALTGEAIRNALLNTKDLDSGGIYPPANMSEDKPWVMSKGRVVQWKDHKLNVLTDWIAGPN